MSNTNKKLSDLLKAVKERATEINSVIVALTAAYILFKDKPAPFVFAITALSGTALWLSLLYVWMAKDQSRFDPNTSFPRFGKRKRIAALTGMVILPLLVAGLAYFRLRPVHPSPLDCPPLAVTIAGFKPANKFIDADRAQAQQVRENFVRQLNERIEKLKDQSIKAKEKEEAVINNPFFEWENAARQLGQSEAAKAHVVVYGELLNVDTVKASVYVCRVNRCDNQAAQMAAAPPIQTVNPLTWRLETDIKSQEQVRQALADMTMFVIGLAFYEQNDWGRADEVLKQSNIPEAHFYRGLIDWELAWQGDSLNKLNSAAAKFQDIINNAGGKPLSPEFIADAQVNAGCVAYLLSQADPRQADTHIREAKDFYQEALKYYESAKDEERAQLARAVTTCNLAIAEIAEARTQEPKRRQALFDQAQDHFETALKCYQRSQYPYEWMATTANLGSLLLEQSATAKKPIKKLTKAKERLDQALEAINQNGSPRLRAGMQYQQAQIRSNLAMVYSNEAFETMMQLDKAEELYRQAGAVFAENSSDWAGNEVGLGLALTLQARLPENQPRAAQLLDDALKEFAKALRVYDRGPKQRDSERYDPEQWALTTAYCADAHREKSKHTDDKKTELSIAVDLATQALAVLKSSPQTDLARVQQILGDTYYELSLLRDSDRMSYLEKAGDAYKKAQNIWNSYGYHYDQSKAEEGLRKVQ